jgi:phosphoglycerate dehydrogenase-like enzyme
MNTDLARYARVAVTSPSFSATPELVQRLREISPVAVINESGRRLDEAALIDFLQQTGTEALIVGLEPVTARVLDACPHVRFIAKYGVGLDNLDLDAMRARHVSLGWTGGVNRRSVSELVLAFMLGHVRNAVPSICAMRAGRWTKAGGVQLSNLAVGIVGFGYVGTDLAGLLSAFGSTVFYNDIVDRSAEATRLGAIGATYPDLLARCDVISFHVPLSPETARMYDASAIALTKPGALVVNTSRGAVVDIDAAIDAVRSGRLGGLALDVYPDEPFDGRPFADLPTVYLTPHIGGNARQAILAMGHAALDNLTAYVNQQGFV